MALEIKWTLQAEKGLDSVIDYLEKKWSPKEIFSLKKTLIRLQIK